jgi:hypothetical protein
VPQHSGMHGALVSALKSMSSRLGVSSKKKLPGKGTLKKLPMFLAQPSGVHHFCCRRCQRYQKNSPPHRSNDCFITPFPTSPQGTALAGLTENSLPPSGSRQISDPRDFHGNYPANFDSITSKNHASFDSMTSKDAEKGGGPRQATMAGVPGASPRPPNTAKPTAMSTRSQSHSQSRSSPRGYQAKEPTKPPVLILEALHSIAKTILKMPPESFAQVVARPPSPNAPHTVPAEMTPAKFAIASATNDLTKAMQKH